MKKGFTLIELVIVIVILGILAAVAIPKFVDLTNSAKNAATQGALGGLRSAIAIFYAQTAINNSGNASFPTASSQIEAAMSQGIPTNANNGKMDISIVASAATADAGWVYTTADGKIYAGNNTTW